VAWMPEATASRTNGLDALARGFAARGLLAVRLREAVDAATAAVPHLSAPAAEQLMAQSEARVLEPDQAFRRSLAALARSRVRPLAMDVGFFEVPLCNRPGVLFADGGGAADRAAIALAVIAEAAVTRHDRHGQASRWSDRDVGLPV